MKSARTIATSPPIRFLLRDGRTAADISVAGSSRPSISLAPLLSLLSPHSGAFQRAFHAKYRIGNAETPRWMK